MTRGIVLVVVLCAAAMPASVQAADLGFHRPHHRHHRTVREEAPIVVPQGYAYGGYGPGPGAGWVEGYGPGFAPGITPGWGYVPAGAAPTILDLGF